jgi:thiol-disulfide isomerase/thioredoxin
VLLTTLALTFALAAEPDPETRVVEYLARTVRPGQAVEATVLYNEVFKAPDERAVLNRLFNVFFKIPLFAVQYQKGKGRPPSLADVAEQFHLRVPGEADVLLRIMDVDPRVPSFLHRDPATGEITRVDVDAVLADPKFGKELERTIAGWEGVAAPAFSATTWDGKPLSSATLAGRPYVVYFWFTGCPPCTRTAPLLMQVRAAHAAQGLEVVGANADGILELPYSDADRLEYTRKLGIAFPLFTATAAMQESFGAVSVFPTLFFVDRKGTVVRQLVGLQDAASLEQGAALAITGR